MTTLETIDQLVIIRDTIFENNYADSNGASCYLEILTNPELGGNQFLNHHHI